MSAAPEVPVAPVAASVSENSAISAEPVSSVTTSPAEDEDYCSECAHGTSEPEGTTGSSGKWDTG